MALDIHFNRDIRQVLDSLRQANERALSLAQRYGLNMEVAAIYKEIYSGALDDVATAFGFAEQTVGVLIIPMRMENAARPKRRQSRPWDGKGPLSM